VVTAADDYVADLYVEDVTIPLIGESPHLHADKVIDASGKYVLPGASTRTRILDMPFGRNGDDRRRRSRGRLRPRSAARRAMSTSSSSRRGTHSRGALEALRSKANGKSDDRHGLHMAVTDLREGGTLGRAPRRSPTQGITSYKLFMAYKGRADGRTTRRSSATGGRGETGALVMVHAENGDVIDVLVKEALAAGNTEPLYHALTRAARTEGGVRTRDSLCALARAPLYVVHLTCNGKRRPIAAGAWRRAGTSGRDVHASTSSQAWTTSRSRTSRCEVRLLHRPSRDAVEPRRALDAVRTTRCRDLDDHWPSAFSTGQKTLGKDDFSKIPNGGPGHREPAGR